MIASSEDATIEAKRACACMPSRAPRNSRASRIAAAAHEAPCALCSRMTTPRVGRSRTVTLPMQVHRRGHRRRGAPGRRENQHRQVRPAAAAGAAALDERAVPLSSDDGLLRQRAQRPAPASSSCAELHRCPHSRRTRRRRRSRMDLVNDASLPVGANTSNASLVVVLGRSSQAVSVAWRSRSVFNGHAGQHCRGSRRSGGPTLMPTPFSEAKFPDGPLVRAAPLLDDRNGLADFAPGLEIAQQDHRRRPGSWRRRADASGSQSSPGARRSAGWRRPLDPEYVRDLVAAG